MNSTGRFHFRDRVVAVLGRAEKECTELILDAIGTKSRSGTDMAGHVAIKLREIQDELKGRVTSSARVADSARVSGEANAKGSTPKRRDYPRFHIENGNLVKTGWSKKGKKEYVHKATRAVYEKVVDLVSSRAAHGDERFPAEEIVRAAEDLQEPIPGYQVYLSLAFLRHVGAVQKDGRRGYSAAKSVKEFGLKAWKDSEVTA